MQKGDKFVNSFTLDVYTYDGNDSMGNIVLINKDGDIRQVGELYFSIRYVPYTEEVYQTLKNNKYKRGVGMCEKSTDDLE